MGERIVVSGLDRISVYACPPGEPLASCALERAGALCAAKDALFAACGGESVIWRLDKSTLVPTGVFAGGPGIAQLMLSCDGRRLYALCSEADSLLMLSAETGMPMVLARAGVNPADMALDERGETIAVAGGACGEVLLLSARSLRLMGRLPVRGMVFSVVTVSGAVYALSLTETMDSVLTAFLPSGIRREMLLSGMPGALAAAPQGIAAATHRALYWISFDAGTVLRLEDVPGRAGRLCILPEGMMMTDQYSDALCWKGAKDARWRLAAKGVSDALIW